MNGTDPRFENNESDHENARDHENHDSAQNAGNSDSANATDNSEGEDIAFNYDALDDGPEPRGNEGEGENEHAYHNESTSRIETLEAELAKAKDHMMRALADAENTRRRGQKDREDIRKYAVTEFARDLLDFSDNFGRALESLPKEIMQEDERLKNVLTGIQAMESTLIKTFEKHGIRKIEPLDEPFSPNFHEVMFEAPGTGKPAGTVVQIIEPGYILHDRLLRPARVGIAKDEGQSADPYAGDNVDTSA